MSLSTKRHTIPMVLGSRSVTAQSIAFNGKIWIICDEVKSRNVQGESKSWQSRVLVFDSGDHSNDCEFTFENTESEVFSEITCTPIVFSSELRCLAADEINLYMWRTKWDANIREKNYTLYKLNRTTLEWENILAVNRLNSWKSVVILNQIMYVLERAYDEIVLITINLPEGKIVEIESLSLSSTNEFLTTHSARLYLINSIGRYRKVFEINNGELIEIAQKELDLVFDFFMNPVHCADSNECVAYLHGYGHQSFEFQAFDFQSLKWESEVIRPDWLKDFSVLVKSVVKVNGLLYILVRKPKERQLKLNVLDLHPKLTSICLADLANRFFEEKDTQKLEDTKQQLPIPLRTKLDELLKWKNKA